MSRWPALVLTAITEALVTKLDYTHCQSRMTLVSGHSGNMAASVETINGASEALYLSSFRPQGTFPYAIFYSLCPPRCAAQRWKECVLVPT